MNQSANMTTIIKAICKKHNFNYLAADGSTLKVSTGEGFMPLLITAYGKDTLTVAHYYMQNGDVMYDPEVEFLVVPPERTTNGKEQWFAHCSTQPQMMLMGRVVGGYMPVMELDYSGKFTSPKTIRFKAQASLASFGNMWGRNIRNQGFLDVEPKPIETISDSMVGWWYLDKHSGYVDQSKFTITEPKYFDAPDLKTVIEGYNVRSEKTGETEVALRGFIQWLQKEGKLFPPEPEAATEAIAARVT